MLASKAYFCFVEYFYRSIFLRIIQDTLVCKANSPDAKRRKKEKKESGRIKIFQKKGLFVRILLFLILFVFPESLSHTIQKEFKTGHTSISAGIFHSCGGDVRASAVFCLVVDSGDFVAQSAVDFFWSLTGGTKFWFHLTQLYC
jgi:hypothetical protein